MNALTGISLWIALVTVIPGLVTLTVILGAIQLAAPDILAPYISEPQQISSWIWFAIAVTIMVLTQALGIILEEILVTFKLLGKDFKINKGLPNEKKYSVYEQHGRLYFLLARLNSEDDAHGHLQRTIAQYFLTNNTLTSFVIGVVITFILALHPNGAGISNEVILYLVFLVLCILLSYTVAVIRFREMAKSIWAVKKVKDEEMSRKKLSK